MSTHHSIPKGYIDNVSTKRPQLSLLYGTSLAGGHSLRTAHHLPPLSRILHGQPHQTYNALVHGRGIGGNNTTHVIQRTALQRKLFSWDNSGLIPRRPVRLDPGNSSYASRIAHSVLIDTNTALSPHGAASNPLAYSQALARSKEINSSLSHTLGRQRGKRNRLPVQRKWYMVSSNYGTR